MQSLRTKKMSFANKTLMALMCLSGCLGYTTENGDEHFVMNVILKCARMENFENCLTLKAAHFLDKIIRMKEPLTITEYLSLARDPNIPDSFYQDLNESTSEGKSGKDEDADGMLSRKLAALFATRTIQLNVPTPVFEGRGDKGDKIFKKGHGIFLMSAMMGGMMMKMAMAKVALIAGKALIIGKIALVLALVIALKKFASHGGGGGPEVVYTSSEHGSGRKLRLNSVWDKDGSDLAYNAHNPDIADNF